MLAVPMKRLVSYCVRNGLSGIEFMAGIPGQLGGALFMNAGTPEKGILDAVMELEVVDSSGHSHHEILRISITATAGAACRQKR